MAIVRRRRTDKDKYGDPGGSPADVTIAGAFTAPRTSADIDGRARNGTVTGLSLFAPYATDIVRTDAIVVDGVEYRIEGDVGHWKNPLTGWTPGLVADLVKADG